MDKLKSLKNEDVCKIGKTLKRNGLYIRLGTDASGIGAPEHTLKMLDIPFKSIFASEIDKYAIASLKANYNPKIIYGDILERNNKSLPNIHGYVCGFPCQAFSHIGLKKGFEDERGVVFFSCYEVIKYKTPLFFVLENVVGLRTHDKGNTFEVIMSHLKSLKNYKVDYCILNSKDYGLPHSRNRIFIIGIRKDVLKSDNPIDHTPKPIPLLYSIDDLKQSDSDIDIARYKLNNYETKNYKVHFGNNDVSDQQFIVDLGSNPKFHRPIINISPCLTACHANYYVSNWERKFTARETLRLMGFSDDFKQVVSEHQTYKQAGNSIPINLLIVIFNIIFKSISIPKFIDILHTTQTDA